ncbi:MAG TPA: hypothetical protein VGW40_16070 [Allosphingosinicella sp.]|nr:hypothetical protein [Allosphingosinicella sp.]
MRLLAAACAAALLAPPAPAGAADVARLDCPLNGLTPAQQAAIVPLATNPRPGATDPAVGALHAAAQRCAAEFAWNDAEKEAALWYSASWIIQSAMRRQLSSDGIDVAEIEQLILTDSQLAAALRSPQPAFEPISDFMTRHGGLFARMLEARAGHPDHARHLGAFVSSRISMEAARFRFAGN